MRRLFVSVAALGLVFGAAGIRVRTEHVEIEADGVDDDVGLTNGDYVLLTVEDDGVGMDDSTLRRAFEPFFTTKAPGQGTGLGLPAVHDIVRSCGGEVRIHSTPGQGTRVRLFLPTEPSRSPHF